MPYDCVCAFVCITEHLSGMRGQEKRNGTRERHALAKSFYIQSHSATTVAVAALAAHNTRERVSYCKSNKINKTNNAEISQVLDCEWEFE